MYMFVISKNFKTDNTQYLHQICMSIYTGLYVNLFVNKNYVHSGIPLPIFVSYIAWDKIDKEMYTV